jgi:F0F1-type ATP synthase assembly protein I
MPDSAKTQERKMLEQLKADIEARLQQLTKTEQKKSGDRVVTERQAHWLSA